MDEFRKRPLETRTYESSQLVRRHPDRIPVLIQAGNKHTPTVERCKYLVPKTTTVGEFVAVIRRMTRVNPTQALFIFIGGVLPPNTSTMESAYQTHRDEDGFLYLTYSLENTFGSL